MADEVSNRVSRDLLPMLRERGIDPAPFFAGLSFTETTLGNARGRIGWDEFTIWLERVELAVGGPEALEHLAGELLATKRALQILGTLAVGTFELYGLGLRIGRSLYRITTARLERLSDGRYRFECRIPSPYRGSLAFMHCTVGSLRDYPRLIGLPESRIVAELDERRAVLWITPPAHQTLLARASSLLLPFVDLLRGRGALDTTPTDLQEAIDVLSEPALNLPEQARLLGRQLSLAPGLEAICECLTRIVGERLNGASCELQLWRGGRLERVWAHGLASPASTLQLPLHRGEQEVGRLVLGALGEVPEDARLLFEALVPWIEAALSEHLPSLEEARLAQLPARLQRIAAELARGFTDKEVASRTGLTVRTVRTYVARIYHALGTHSRGELVALLHQPGQERGPRAEWPPA